MNIYKKIVYMNKKGHSYDEDDIDEKIALCVYIYIASVKHVPYFSSQDYRYCQLCEKSVPIEEYRQHIRRCYDFDMNSTFFCSKRANKGEFIDFYNKKKFENAIDCLCLFLNALQSNQMARELAQA